MANVKDAATIAEYLFPADRYTIVWLFDQSSCHRAFSEDVLNSQRMNVRPGGAKPHMRGTMWAGSIQPMVDENGVPKGMRRVLEERGINTVSMKANCVCMVVCPPPVMCTIHAQSYL